MRITTFAITLVLTCASSVLQAEPALACRASAEAGANCFTLHGRAYLANGTPGLRIWRTGTSRILGVNEQSDLPAALSEVLNWENSVHADFKVCPLTKKKKAEMQMVCIASVKHAKPGKYPLHH